METALQKRKRLKGEGGISQLDERRWRVLYDIGYDAAGKRLRKTAVVYSEKDAIKTLNAFRREQAKGKLVATDNVKVSEFAERWLKLKETATKKTTYNSYVQTVEKYINPFMGNLKLQKVTTATINDFISSEHKRGLSASSIARHRAILHGIIGLAVSEGILPVNVVDRSATIRIEHKDTRALSSEESEKLLRVAREEYQRDKWKGNKFWQLYHIILLAIATGLRRGEIAGLKVSNMDFENNTIRVAETIVEVKGAVMADTPKSKSSNRTISVDKMVMESLKELLKENSPKEKRKRNIRELHASLGLSSGATEDEVKDDEDYYLFRTRDNKPLTPSNINRAFRRVLKTAEIGQVRFHDLRHTHATLLINHGMDPKTVSSRIGHEDIRLTLNQYTHVVSI